MDMKIKNIICNFISEESGQAMTEYILAVVFVTFSGFVFYTLINQAYTDVFDRILTRFTILISKF